MKYGTCRPIELGPWTAAFVAHVLRQLPEANPERVEKIAASLYRRNRIFDPVDVADAEWKLLRTTTVNLLVRRKRAARPAMQE